MFKKKSNVLLFLGSVFFLLSAQDVSAATVSVNSPGDLNAAFGGGAAGGDTVEVNISDTANVDVTNTLSSFVVNSGGNAILNQKANNTPINMNSTSMTVSAGGTLTGGAFNMTGLANSGTVNVGAGQQFSIDTALGGGTFENQVAGAQIIMNLQGGTLTPDSLVFETINIAQGTLQINAASGTFTAGQQYRVARATFGVNALTTGITLQQVGNVVFSLSTDANGQILYATVVSVTTPSTPTTSTTTDPVSAAITNANLTPGSDAAGAGTAFTNLNNGSVGGLVPTAASLLASSSPQGVNTFLNQTTPSSNQMGVQSSVETQGVAMGLVSGRSSVESTATGSAACLFTAHKKANSRFSSDIVTKKALMQEHQKAVLKTNEFMSFNDALESMAEGKASPLNTKIGAHRNGIWAQGYANFMDKRAVDQFTGFNSKTGGVVMGYDYALLRDFMIGLAFNIAHTKIKIDGNGGNTKQRSYSAILYGGKNFGRAYMDASAGIGLTRHHGNRNITLVNATSSNKHGSRDMSARAEGGYKLKVKDKALVKPFVAASFSHIHNNAYVETGAPGLDLSVDKQDSTSRTFEVGARADANIAIAGKRVVPSMKLSWVNKKAGGNGVTSRFSALPSAGTFKGSVDKKAQSLVSSSVATTAYLSQDFSITAYYSGEFNNKVKGHQFGGRLRKTM